MQRAGPRLLPSSVLRLMPQQRWAITGASSVMALFRASGLFILPPSDPCRSESRVRDSVSSGHAGHYFLPGVRLTYTVSRTDEQRRLYDYVVRLQATVPTYGGLKWWFTCPLVVNGQACRPVHCPAGFFVEPLWCAVTSPVSAGMKHREKASGAIDIARSFSACSIRSGVRPISHSGKDFAEWLCRRQSVPGTDCPPPPAESLHYLI
jgi:hypothetical protein